MPQPRAARARLPEGYGLPEDSALLPWSEVDARLAAAKHYWIATVGPGGAPLARPIDGMWLDARLYFGGDDRSLWVRNLRESPAASLNLEDAEQAVSLQGAVSTIRLDPHLADLARRLVDASNAKYDMGQRLEDYEGEQLFVFTPTSGVAWTVLYENATSFTFTP